MDEPRRAGAADSPASVTVDVHRGVASVVLDRPLAGNAINGRMARELSELAERLAGDDTVRVIVLGTSGPTFCVGGDIRLFADTPATALPGTIRQIIDDLHRAMTRLLELDAPIIAAVRGAAAGGGLGLACMADIVIAAETAVFAVGYGGIGLTSDCGNSWFLPRLIGLRRAQQMFLLNRQLTAAEAMDWGIVTTVVPANEVDFEADRIAALIAGGPTQAYGESRRLLRQSFDVDLSGQLAAERRSMVNAAATADAAEGIAAFVGKRGPHFTGGQPPTDTDVR